MAEVFTEEVVYGQWMEHVVEQGIRFGTERLIPPPPLLLLPALVCASLPPPDPSSFALIVVVFVEFFARFFLGGDG